MGERRGTKALETWCRRVTQGYPGVKVENMTTSWRDGLAFCALIHHFRPDLIDFARLEKSDVYGNNDLAFRIAERHLGIPALLDAEDMAEYPVPDRLSILTYLSQFYQAFASNNSSPVKKPSSESPDGSLVSLVQGNVQSTPKMEWRVRGREPCIVCNQPVFIAQRLRVDGRLYHRTCFRCARCEAQLSTADYYETCSGKYVCETCPDEMPVPEETVLPQQQEPLEPPPLPAVPPPSAPPPEPPPSIVAMRRLMFDTDDAKLGKHDHIVHNTRIINSIKKDLSMNDDSRSCVDNIIDNKNKDLVNSDIVKPKDSYEILEADSSADNSEALVENVNSSTIPACSDLSIPQRTDDVGQTSPGTSENEDSNAKLTIYNPEEERPLDLSDGTPSFNENRNSSNVENVIYSDSDDNNDVIHSDISIVVTEDTSETAIEPDSTTTEAINTAVIPSIETRNEIVIAESNRNDNFVEMENNEHPENSKSNIVESETKEQHEYCRNSIIEAETTKEHNDNSENNIVEVKIKEYPDDLNPFDSDDNDDNGQQEQTKEEKSTNPFGSDSEEECLTETVRNLLMKPPLRANNIKSQTLTPMSTNPFGSSDEDEEVTRPMPLPRKSLQSSPEPTPFPRRSKLRSSGRSITSLSSLASSTSPRKKRPAPPPPPTGTSPTIGMSPAGKASPMTGASPTIGRLTPSSRYSSMSSLASTRSRKTRRAPLPPNFMKTPDKPVQQSVNSEEEQAVPQLDISQQSTQSEAPDLKTTGDIYNQIEEGMKKLIDNHDQEECSGIQISVKDEKDIINESSKSILTVDTEESCKTKPIHLESTSLQKDANEEENKEVPPNLEVIDLPLVVNKEQNVGKDSHTTDFEDLNISEVVGTEAKPKGEYHNYTSLVEACNSELKSISKNSSGMFEGMEPIKHSTPVKISLSHIKDSSSEDIPNRNSFFDDSILGSFYSSHPGSVADSTSYQDSLSSPPSEKKYKDSTNMHRKTSVESGVYYPPKSTYGQWKRKKPAPPVPLPQRRIVKPMAMHRIKQELGDIEIKQQELERQGVTLENKIRDKFDSETSITPYVEELVLQLFELVNEKNGLFRKQAELMYLRRQHQLEEEHAELEYQIRCLMARPELNKTDSDKELEEKLIQRLVEVVERRDAIIQCLEMDRIREAEEDKSIHKQLDRLSQVTTTDERMKVTKKHKKKKEKHNTLKMFDLDKEFDESEKESRKKKKWYTLHHKMGKHL